MVAQIGLPHLLLRQLIQIRSVEEIHALRLPPLSPFGQHVVGHVVDTVDKGHGQARIGQLLRPRHRPEAIRQVVVLQRAMTLDAAVAAVVIGQHQSIRRDHLARAAAAEAHHGILQRRPLLVIHLGVSQSQAQGLHVGILLLFHQRQ